MGRASTRRVAVIALAAPLRSSLSPALVARSRSAGRRAQTAPRRGARRARAEEGRRRRRTSAATAGGTLSATPAGRRRRDGRRAATPATTRASSRRRPLDGGTHVFKFSELDIEGRLKSPQLVYFLRRVRAEFAAGDLGHRTFMREMSETRKESSF